MSGARPIGVGVIGLGFMGATHVRAFQSAAASGCGCRLAAVADSHLARLSGQVAVAGNLDTGSSERLFDPSAVRTSVDPADVLSDPDVDLVSICTPTDSHVPLAIAALESGKHVLVEKPVALHSADVQRLADVAGRTDRLCMPAMCMRFWPGWDWLRDRIRDRSFGAVRSASFQRLGSPPTWNRAFYGDPSRSGGALMDLHIHDADFIRWCFGEPDQVVSTGSLSHISTLYRFGEDGPKHVVAEGGQDHAPGFGFRMRYVVAFEQATAEWDLSRTSSLNVYRDGRADSVELPTLSGYERQVRHLVQAIQAHAADRLAATVEDAVATARLLEAERESLLSGRPVRP